uniref:Uncharacterized protein n=1 Tax=Corvus moneduloides TaxID=1196302 RepID=A0A8U7P8E5_CORMO
MALHGQFSHLSLLAGQYSIIPPDSPVLGVVGDGAVLPCQLQGRIIPEKLSIQNLRIPGWVGWEGPLAHPVPSPSMGRGTSRYSRMFQALSKLALDTSRDGAATASLGIPFQPLSALPVKNFFPISRLLREFLVCPLLELDFSRCAAQGAEPSVFLDGHAGNGISLSCRSQGWFPAPSVVWLDSQGQTRPEEVTTRSTPGPSSGIFDVVSSMSLELGSDREVSCRAPREVVTALTLPKPMDHSDNAPRHRVGGFWGCAGPGGHRIPGLSALGKASKDIWSNHWLVLTRAPSAMSSHSLDTSRDGDSVLPWAAPVGIDDPWGSSQGYSLQDNP